MNAVLDYDALEILGAALREARREELDEPLNENLRSLCQQLEAEREPEPEGSRAVGARDMRS